MATLRLGLKGRILLIAAVAMVASIVVLVSINTRYFSQAYANALQSRSVAVATTLKIQLERILNLGIPLRSLTGFEVQLREAVEHYQGIRYALVVTPQGTKLFDSRPGRNGGTLDEQEVLAAVAQGRQSTVFHQDHNGAESYAAIVPVMYNQTHQGAIVVDFSGDLVDSLVVGITRWNILIAALLLLSGLAVMMAGMTAFVTRPLERLIANLQQLRFDREKLSRRVEVPGDSEMGILARSFNQLLDELEKTTVSKWRYEHGATHDALTGLPNRLLMRERIDAAIAHARRHDRHVAVAFVDLDNFKVINDSLGHDKGDLLLQQVGGRLAHSVRKVDTVARIGGDEFVVVYFDQPRVDGNILPLVQRLQQAVDEPVLLDGREYRITSSIGIAVFPQDGQAADQLLRHADEAMYRAKELGRNTFATFSQQLHRRFTERLSLQNGLRQAIEQHQFEVYYQPQLDLERGCVSGVEALVRWNRPGHGVVSPGVFIAEAEDSGLITPIGEQVLYDACRQLKAWHDGGIGPLRVAVNVSPRQFWQSNLVEVVKDALQQTGLDAHWLELELTEGLIMREVDEAIAIMRDLTELGVSLAIDDFGTGYSSLTYLKRFPIRRLKIAQEFMHEIPGDEDSVAIAQSVVALGHSMRLTVIAEGVESDEQLAFLRSAGCDEIQGYLIGRPLPADEFAKLYEMQCESC